MSRIRRRPGGQRRVAWFRLIDATRVPEAIARLNWLSFTTGTTFDRAYATLIETIETDLVWARAHARLLVRARDWESHGKDPSYLIGGTDLEESEHWLTQATDRHPSVTSLQVAYVAASRGRESERQRNQLRGFYLVSLIYGVLQTGVSYFVAFDDISEEGLIALSPFLQQTGGTSSASTWLTDSFSPRVVWAQDGHVGRVASASAFTSSPSHSASASTRPLSPPRQVHPSAAAFA